MVMRAAMKAGVVARYARVQSRGMVRASRRWVEWGSVSHGSQAKVGACIVLREA